jgi:hypothetical protein
MPRRYLVVRTDKKNKQARLQHKVDAGVVLTTAIEPTLEFAQRRDVLEAELAIDIKVILLDEFIGLLLQHLAPTGHG